MQKKLFVTNGTILKKLKNYNFKKSILEYIENGLDAGSTDINIEYEKNPLGLINTLKIRDNGTGIKYDLLEDKFGAFGDSKKIKSKYNSSTSGKDGIGRLTFISFCSNAKWITTYEDKSILSKYDIQISANSPENWNYSELSVIDDGTTGTTVEFTELDESVSEHIINNDLKKIILESLSWRLLLTGAKIYLQGYLLDPTELIQSQKEDEVDFDDYTYDIKFIKWHESPKGEESRFYFKDSKGNEKYKIPTSFNRQGDGFFHSLYIQSSYFDNFTFLEKDSYGDDNIIGDENDGFQEALFESEDDNFTPRDKIFKGVRKTLNKWLLDTRKPYIISQAEYYLKELEEEGILEKGESVVEEFLYENTRDFLEELYLHSPKFLKDQTEEQKGVFIRLVYMVLQEGSNTKIFEILDKVLDLDENERDDFSRILQNIELSNVIKTISLINDRLDVIRVLEQFVYNPDLSANEVNDLQGIISKHYWLFGDEYTYVSDEEPNFQEIMNRYLHLLRGFSTEQKYLDDPDRLKQVDLFISKKERYVFESEPFIKNIIVEIKHPSKMIGIEQYTQTEKYMETIRRNPEFNGGNFEWRFILIGTKHNDFIDNQLKSNVGHGRSVIQKPDNNYTFYYKDWNQVIEENKSRLEYLRDKLNIKHKDVFERAKIEDKEEGHSIAKNSAALKDEFGEEE